MRKLVIVLVILVLIIGGLKLVDFIKEKKGPEPGTVQDEAMIAGRDAASFPAADEDYFRDMDYGVTKNAEAVRASLNPYVPGIGATEAATRAVRGRNNWIVWTAGNDRFWDQLSSKYSFGTIDLLKTISSHKSAKHGRHDRWHYLGVVNEPCFRKPTGPRTDRFNLWLDERITSPECGPDPFENEQKYPGVKIGSRGTTVPVGSFYGYATGVVGLRLFPNPDFDEKAKAHWDAEKYYTTPEYYNDKKLVKPYRVAMSCGFCHVGPNPSNPPADPENPTWANLNSNPGAQYFWVDRIFVYDPQGNSFPYQLFHTSRPGALDTSFVSSDMINNPRTMNAVYNLGARLEIARKWGAEELAEGELDNKQFNEYVPAGTALTAFWDEGTHTSRTPHVLKDGADSVGALGALNRVFINIGLFSEEWVLHFIPLVGGPHTSAIKIADLEKNSSYWRATEAQTPDLALFFLAATPPDLLKNAPGGAAMISADATQLTRGKEVFAERCARCHSSKLPEKAFTDHFKPGCIGPDYLKCWNDYWQWTKTAEFKDAMKPIVMAEDFTVNNAMTTDLRIPVTLLETNVCSPLATNALAGNIWDNFSSHSYKSLPAVGKVKIQHPYTYAVSDYEMPAGGRGYTRPPSLTSLWSTAPFLLNNTVGTFYPSGSVPDRVASFNDGINKMLWPEKREGNMTVVTLSGKQHPGWIDRTPEATYLTASAGYLPKSFARLSGLLHWLLPNVVSGGDVKIGPIPSGTPINLVSNINLENEEVVGVLLDIKHDLADLPANATEEQARAQFAPLVPKLLEVSKCRDFVINKGHYFGTDFLPPGEGEPGLSDDDKRALIEFLKTF
jgi:cytochrome c5